MLRHVLCYGRGGVRLDLSRSFLDVVEDDRLGGGGVTTIREFPDADLVDTPHLAVSPVKLGSGLRLREAPDELLDRFHLEVVASPSGVTHHLFRRK